MNTLAEVTEAARTGKTVCWKQRNYRVVDWARPGQPANWTVVCTDNNHAVGLFHLDGVTSDHDPADFYTLED